MDHIDNFTNDMHSLQVVMSYGTDHTYRLRCLPWFLNKTYMNRHVFDGPTRPDYRVNEFYYGKESLVLGRDGQPSPRDQLYMLFTTYGIDDTFSHLTEVAETSAQNFFIQRDLYKNLSSVSSLDMLVTKNIEDLIADCFAASNNLSVSEIVTGMTFQLLKNSSAFLHKNY